MNVDHDTEKLIPVNPKIKAENFLKDRNQLNFLIAHTSHEEVLDIVYQLENKSTGPQGIPIKLLKLIPDLILIPLCKIINHSFQTGVYPDALKVSEVIPIHKAGSTEELDNYRPIALLSIFNKIIEKLLNKSLYDLLQENNILCHKNNSTTFALIEITEKINEPIDDKRYGCGIFIDLRKAFDTVNHDILLRKLDNISEVLQFYYFADDTNIYYEAESINKLETVINKEIRKLDTWLIVNRLSLNIAKTNLLILHPYNKPINQRITIKIHKKAISESECIKYLGVMVDSTLTWNIYIDKISKTISRATGLLYKITPFVNNKILRMLYHLFTLI